MSTVNITIDGKLIQAQAGQTVLQAAEAGGIHIPVLCHHPALPPEGACRVCLVEIARQRNLQTACTFPVAEGMVISTHSSKVVTERKFSLELLVSDHPLDCMTCEATGNCELQDLAYEYGVTGRRYMEGTHRELPVDDPNPFIQVDRNKCILCGRCVRACTYINGVEAIHVVGRGFDARIGFGMDSTMEDSPCEFCGSCVEVCPTGALWPKMSIGKGRPWQEKQIQTTCSYCGVGCQLILHVRGNEIVRVSGAPEGPGNHGFTCVKGRFGYDFVNHPDRLTRPLVRRYLLEGKPKPGGYGGLDIGESATLDAQHPVPNTQYPVPNTQYPVPNTQSEFVEVSWDQAIELVARKWADIKAHYGGDAFAAFASAKCTNEENYLMQKLTRQVMGTHNVDHCARL